MNIPILVFLCVESFLLIGCIVFLIFHIINFRKYVEKYNKIWSNFENENLEKDIEYLIQNMAETRKASEEARISSEAIDAKMIKSLQKVGLVKYDAYDGGKNNLSFALAMLNSKDDGVLINSVYTRNGSNIYAKSIVDGMYEGALSKEEEKALQVAMKSKSFI